MLNRTVALKICEKWKTGRNKNIFTRPKGLVSLILKSIENSENFFKKVLFLDCLKKSYFRLYSLPWITVLIVIYLSIESI